MEKYDVIAGIAIVGMACRFPGAKNTQEFWCNLRDGIESISFFSEQEVLSSGVDPVVLAKPNYIKAGGILDDVELFDAQFFGFTPREAEIMDPQHRFFLECAWEALENAGYDPETYKGPIGLYAGTGTSSYLLNNLHADHHLIASLDPFETLVLNDKDFLTTRVAYELNLRGPAVTIQTACSTSLVAVHMACQSLLNYQCDIALAGGVRIQSPQKKGYLYQEGMILSPDGHCRAFDAKARGVVRGNGVGIVVLKRLTDALAEGDCIHAVIKGSATNNDGSSKVGYTAPSVDGQAEVIALAQAISGIEPETVSYIEAHGTGTSLGDPIEIAGLTQAFRTRSQKKSFCAVGSVKTNIGHTDAAAGIAGLIKTVQALQHGLLPPTLNFERPNPEIDFENSPFYVNTRLSEWKRGETPRRAGVSSFGIGGTNAHLVVEEAPLGEPSGPSRPWQLLVLSAKTPTALDAAARNLAAHLKQHSYLNLADVAYTLKVGRRAFSHRRIVVCREVEDALSALETLDPKQLSTYLQESEQRPVAFMFPGQGAQYVNMALGLYHGESTFREDVDRCSELLKPHLGLDLRDVLYPAEEQVQTSTKKIGQTAMTQPALFVIQYAMARLCMKWGIRPAAMIGHSVGEYVAACLAGVFSLEDALTLVAARGRLMNQLPPGSMLAVPLPEEKVAAMLDGRLSLAAVNGPSLCVVSGPTGTVDEFEKQLAEEGTECRRLHTSHAFHSEMMEPILKPFTEEVGRVKLNVPKIPYLSNFTGTWITATEATDPIYWASQLRETVRFGQGLRELLKRPDHILLEVGPGQTLSSVATRHPDKTASQIILSLSRHPRQSQSDEAFLLNTVGKLWLSGVCIDWTEFYHGQRRQRVPLPTYPFEPQRYWVEPERPSVGNGKPALSLEKKADIADWFYVPSWKRFAPQVLPQKPFGDSDLSWLVFIDECGVGSQMVKRLEQEGQDVVAVKIGDKFSRLGKTLYTINPRNRGDYNILLQELCALDKEPCKILHFWGVTPNEQTPSGTAYVERVQDSGLFSLLFLVQAFSEQQIAHPLEILLVSDHIQEVTGEEILCPEKATVLGACKVIPVEYSNIRCCSVDIVLPPSGVPINPRLIDALLAELTAKPSDAVVAYRGNHRWVQTFEPVRLEKSGAAKFRLREGGNYLITGGLGGIGLTLAEHLARTARAKLILTGRSAFPAKDYWQEWLGTHDEADPISAKIRKLRSLEAQGAEVLVFSADVASQDDMHAVVAHATDRFGQIHGVIHCAGVPDYAGVIDRRSREMTESVMAAKVRGTLVLDHILRGADLDFLVLCSTLGSVLYHGKFGQVGYCAANEFLDAFACYKSLKEKTFTVSINWCDWQEVGMSREARKRWAMTRGIAETILDEVLSLSEGLSPSEGIEAFSHILESEYPQIVVSPQDLRAMIEQDKASSQPAFLRSFEKVNPLTPFHERPELRDAYVSPSNEIEQCVAEIWKDLLGFDPIGVCDNFFDLGGHSLLATQILSRLRDRFRIDLSLHTFFEKLTVRELAQAIVECQAGSGEGERL